MKKINVIAIKRLGMLLCACIAGPALCAGQSVPVFSCSLGSTQVEVVARGKVLHYQYGRPGKPELSLSGDANSGTVSYRNEMWPHAEDKQLRFRNGDFSYVVYNRWASPSYEGKGGEDHSGLLVFKGDKLISNKACRKGGEFGSVFDLSTLPKDADNVIPDPGKPSADTQTGQATIVGNDRDAHGCIGSAGYSWSDAKKACVRSWEEEKMAEPEGDAQAGINDDRIHEFGRIVSVEDGAYPMYSVTMEFPERRFMVSFSLNVEAVTVDQTTLNKAIGKYATIYYTSELVPSLFDMTLDGRSVLDSPTKDSDQTLEKMTGVLSGAEETTQGDLPGMLTVTEASGKQLQIPYFVPEEMLVANGKQVTVHYLLRGENNIVGIEFAKDE